MNPLSYFDSDEPCPESDGQPVAENTEQYEWLVKNKENLEILFADHPDVFIAADLLWYPAPDRQVAGPLAPDVMVAFGRPKGRRGYYKQWDPRVWSFTTRLGNPACLRLSWRGGPRVRRPWRSRSRPGRSRSDSGRSVLPSGCAPLASTQTCPDERGPR